VLRDPRLGAFTGDDPPANVAAMRATIKRWVAHDPADPERWRNWIVRRSGDGKAVGHIQATVRGTVAELAWVIAVDVQGRGYATEATRAAARSLRDDDGIGTLEATIAEGHVASEGVARHLGLVVTGEVRDGERVWRRSVP
jgi:RimJ/RimL family protein N-acetyltransferase